jgi:N-acetylated-alpha-linked acidic dipeptidase
VKTAGLSLCALCVLCVLGVLGVESAPQEPGAVIYGFTARSSIQQRTLESRFLLLPSPDKAREAHAFLTAEPHVAGSPRDRVLADWTRDRWREYGLEQVEITEHQVLLPYATDVVVEMPGWRASLKEDPVEGDPSTAVDTGLPYHAYSASGDVTAPVVYAGSGNPADYDWLAAHGITIAGKIALVRYSVPYSYRGFKALTAQQRGAAGILIYSDPADDGARKGKTYPDGPWGPESHIQRGGIVYDFNVPGDPLTPGWASVPGARRIAAKDAASLPSIMSVPLSAKDARVILQALKGPQAPKEWQGGLPFTYRVGGAARVHMRVKMDDAVRPIWTVTGRITGTTNPDEVVIVGNHRDAWVYGGVDPSSGSASLMELARALGSLSKQGAKPKRTIVFASWDAEEFTLTSSTEWGEEHERELAAHAVAYLNVDSSASGTSFGASAVPSLNRLVTQAAESVIDPETGKSIADATRTGRPRQGGALPGASGPDLVNNRLGSGSDYTVFLNFIGVPIVDMSFTGPYGVYHSVYDDHLWMQKFGDPGFRYHAAMTRLWGVMALRLANADVVPIDYRPYAARVGEFIGELASARPAADRGALQPARDAAERFARAADAIQERIDAALSPASSSTAALARINAALMGAERALLSPDGIPGRPWYRHLIYAPAPTYAPELLPGVAEAIASHDRRRIADQVSRLAEALDRAASVLRSTQQ